MPMMAGLQMEGVAESGYGIKLSGFHCSALEFPKKLGDFTKDGVTPGKISQCESNSYVSFLMCSREGLHTPAQVKIATFRREPHRFFIDLATWLRSTRAMFVDDMILSQSYGSLTLTLMYRPAPEEHAA